MNKRTRIVAIGMTHEGQQFCADLLYAPLPKEAVAKAEKIVKSMNYSGQPILK